MKPQLISDPPDRLVHLTVLVSAKIEDGNLARTFLESKQDGVETILNVQIGFPLTSVAQHRQLAGIFAQTLVEIEYMPVTIPLTQYRNETEDIRLETVSHAIG